MAVNHTLVETQTSDDILESNKRYEDRAIFGARFRRCRRLLYSLASRMLDSDEEVEAAVHNCWIAAFRSAPRFEHEGAFRCWLFRVLINEALAILHTRKGPARRSST